ncbi:vWFA domain containing protein [uncultured Caudovirales phage]|uniref:VWFA domain containing protein n=1 Tax=uncultured Caudovirales phage TaxID=2100421 RepID=A0A6J5L6A5_9CAUD|nr:vWFA domain containing protein [uncultured Caudovirales phage]
MTTLAEKSKSVTVTDPKVDAAAKEKLVTARIGLLLRAPFFGNLATRMNLINADEWCPTAATDGRRFYYNSEFVNSLPLKQLEFLVGHEVLHAVYDHMGRRGNRDPKLWNIADDYCVNWDLVEQRVGDKIPVALYDSKYKGMSAEEVYDDLYENADKINIDDLMKRLLDEHLDGTGEDGEGEDGDKKGGNGRPKLSEQEKKEIRDEIKEAVLAAANASGAGNIPGGVKRMIKDLTEPVMDWRELLQQQIESTVKSDFTWARPSRRSWHMDAVMPGMKPGEQIDVVIGIDTSGSITDKDLKVFLSEIKGIMEAYDEYRITVMGWDTEVHNVGTFTSDNLEDISSFEPGGGGGTDPHCVWNYLQANDIEPKKLIMFTDFCFFGWSPEEVEQYCDTVWIIKGNKSAEPEFGVYAHYEDAEK